MLRESFTRLFNIFRLNKSLARDAYSDYSLGCQHLIKGKKIEGAEYCLFLELTEFEVERRGEFWGWPYREVDNLINLACSAASGLMLDFGMSAEKEAEKGYMGEMRAFSNLLMRLHKVDSLPFAGCQTCPEQCHYRFDMKCMSDDILGKDFRMAFLDPNIETKEIAKICWAASRKSFFRMDIRSRRNASLCFAVQQLGELEMASYNQIEMAKQLADNLAGFTV